MAPYEVQGSGDKPGLKFIVTDSGTCHAWVLGETKTFCGKSFEGEVELLTAETDVAIDKYCQACENKAAKMAGREPMRVNM